MNTRGSLHTRFLTTIVGISGLLLVLASVLVYQLARDHFVTTERASVGAMVMLRREPQEHSPLFAPPFADLPQLQAMVRRAMQSRQAESEDLALRHADGSLTWAHCMLNVVDDEAQQVPHIEGVLYDITTRHAREHAARHLADHDGLTGLKSRSFVESWLETHISQARERRSAVTLIFVDLDGFKAVNDQWGHAAGDAVLVEAAERMRTLFKRSSDVIARLGGDELVVALDGLSTDDAQVPMFAARLVAALGEDIELPGGQAVRIGASVGVACYPLHAASAADLIRAADQAMYAVKRHGKHAYRVADRLPQLGEALPAETPPGCQEACDPLTGLPDRRGLLSHLEALQSQLAREGQTAAVVCLDLDDFKAVNLAYGPQAGDEVLRAVAQSLREVLHDQAYLARSGSDEFVALIPMAQRNAAEALEQSRSTLAKLSARLAATRLQSGQTVMLQASKGLSLLTPQSSDPQQVLQEAQLALRLCKQKQRGGQLAFEATMMDGFLQQRSLEEDLRQALARHQFHLLVQPQIGADGQVIGGEALLRWQHPVRGLVSPAEFIPLAERSGAILELGLWVLQRGCAILAQMQARSPAASLSINISPLQFNHPAFESQMQQALQDSGAAPQGLMLEITEGLLLSDLAQVGDKMRRITQQGVRFSIDDFGTGFSSLNYLRRLPLHEIKIDRSFVAGLPQDQPSVGIVRSILSMGHHLHLNLVAEGVETAEQARFLAEHQCNVQQGWLHGHPMPVEAFLARLAAPQPQSALEPV
ncbi:MAG: hypothetical protein C4K60_05145 [Ideonella sp. MAG2]|nr:MAG: hypothetical protein C4K60_05145 [Ideonella sp. MAG2]